MIHRGKDKQGVILQQGKFVQQGEILQQGKFVQRGETLQQGKFVQQGETLHQGRIFLILSMVALSILLSTSCKQSYTPKPTGYLRVDYPEKSYHLYSDQEFFAFEIPDYAVVEIDSGPRGHEGWINVAIPQLNGKIHLSYKPVGEDLTALITDCRELVYKHTVKAQGIEETPFIDREKHRFGMVYDLKGEVASAVQFFITDSTDHFLRGSLYFNIRPNRDSLNPVIDFLREDIIHLIETTQWKY